MEKHAIFSTLGTRSRSNWFI